VHVFSWYCNTPNKSSTTMSKTQEDRNGSGVTLLFPTEW
jgi:hypothetical protein